ncbi:MAG TPA: ABC transporter ATP-binding protein [Chloroflexia bacterium]|nr:ABC transporter ATP-binding protein [Chloroflexia bacterium]
MAQPILQAEGLTREFATGRGATSVLNGVDLTVDRGQFVAIMGPSGSGKSTLLHILGGLDLPTRGRVVIDGTDLNRCSDADRARLRREKTSFIFQFFNLIPYLSAEDNILLPNLLGGGQRGRDYRARLKDVIAEMGLQGHEQSRPDYLAGGEQQRVAIARALLLRPALILADEPTGNLDYHTGREILHLLWRTAYEWGRTVLLVTHDARSAAYAEKVYIMRDGAWAAEVPLRQIDPAGWENHDVRALVPVLQKLSL